MTRSWLLIAALVCTVFTPRAATAGSASFSLNLNFNDPANTSSGGIWTAVGKLDEFGLAGVSMALADANFDSATGFVAPPEFEVQVAASFGPTVINLVIGSDSSTPPLLGVGEIGSSWPSSYVDDPSLVPFGGYPDLGSFTGGVALAWGSFDPGVIPDWTLLPGDNPTAANLYASSGFPVSSAETQLTVRDAVPEPSSSILLGAGVAMLLLLSKTRRTPS